MATRRKTTQQKNGSSPLGYTLFGIVVGLGIAAAGAYYLRDRDDARTQVATSSRPSAQTVVNTAPVAQPRPEPSSPPAAVPVVPPATTPATVTSPSTPVVVSNTKPTAKPTPQIDTTKQLKAEEQSPDRIGNLIHSMNEAKPAPESKIGPTYLQVGAFKSFAEADAKRAQLLMHGFDNVSMSKTKVDNTEYVRVRIGPFSDQKALKDAQSRLKAQNINASQIR